MGRKSKAEHMKAKNITFKLYDWEIKIIRELIKTMHQRSRLPYENFKNYTITKELLLSAREQFIKILFIK